MLNKTTWFSVVAASAVLGSMAMPILASAHETDTRTEVTAAVTAKPEVKHEKILGRHLATALNITPDALAAAVKAARAAVPPLTEDQKKDPAARLAHEAALEAAIAQQLGITTDAFNAAQAAAKAALDAKKDEHRAAAEDKAEAHFAKTLARLVSAGVLTQAQSDEALAQFKQGGDARESVIKRLRVLLHDGREDKRDEKRTAKDDKKKGEQGEQKRPGLERAPGQRDGKSR